LNNYVDKEKFVINRKRTSVMRSLLSCLIWSWL